MGNFRIEVEAVGAHGDFRAEVKDGDTLPEVEDYREFGLDVTAFHLVEELRQHGAQIIEAKIRHWPGTDDEVVDDIYNKVRRGSFAAEPQ